ncbi:MAG: hypothetical protein HY898_10360 [Deltaproteobacteria bacterium]|nr:hypothetical protein [Deltaproteobacteria bacterium]
MPNHDPPAASNKSFTGKDWVWAHPNGLPIFAELPEREASIEDTESFTEGPKLPDVQQHGVLSPLDRDTD